MKENNWCTCAEFNARTAENYNRRAEAWAREQAEQKAKADRYYKRIVIRHTVRTVAADLALITAMAGALVVLFRCVVWCL